MTLSQTGNFNVLNDKLEKLVAARKSKSLVREVLTAISKEIISTADDIVNIDDHDERREAWGEFIEELGVPWKDMMK